MATIVSYLAWSLMMLILIRVEEGQRNDTIEDSSFVLGSCTRGKWDIVKDLLFGLWCSLLGVMLALFFIELL
jgi:ABC-type uncharacterized transport system permease subunit